MKEIIVRDTTRNYPLGAAEECSIALQKLGIPYPKIKPQRGSHGAEVWILDADKKKFEEEILPNCIVGTYRKFYFSRVAPLGQPMGYYYVSYRSKTS